MKRITVGSYRKDTLYPRVVLAVTALLDDGLPVSAPAVFVRMGMLSENDLAAWRSGRVPYLERVIHGSLGKASRTIRILAFHARDLGLVPTLPHSAGPIKRSGRMLRFSKSGDVRLEDAYRRVFVGRAARASDSLRDGAGSIDAGAKTPGSEPS